MNGRAEAGAEAEAEEVEGGMGLKYSLLSENILTTYLEPSCDMI
jgi:hypothetical protein